MYKYNDNELLYLISENDDLAKEIMIEKYKPLIISYIQKAKIDKNNFDDYFQEGLLCLIKAINTYNEMYYNSFNNYFSILLKRKYIDLFRKNNKDNKILFSDKIDEYIIDNSELIKEDVLNEDINVFSKLSTFEKQIYIMKYVERNKPQEIANKLNIDVKKVYDAIFRIKRKQKS